MNNVTIGKYLVGRGQPLLWILGPCVIESYDHTMMLAERIALIASNLNLPWVYKSSFDKANRSSGRSFRGLGIDEGLKILASVREQFAVPVLTDVHDAGQCDAVAQVCDILQIPAFLARQTDLLEAAGRTGKVINVKKGQFMAPWDMKNVVTKLRNVGNEQILLCERGTTFGYGMLVNDFRAIPWMQEIGQPVIFDATHSVQTPGALGDRTGGDRTMVPYLTRAAVAAGCDGVFIETHQDPDNAPSDGPNMLPIDKLINLLDLSIQIRELVSRYDGSTIV